MTWHMVHFSEIESLSSPQQFLAFSEAYLESAGRLCDALAASPAESTYPKGAVVMSLAFHGIELFVKAAILKKDPAAKFRGAEGHDLDKLHQRYANLYPAKEYVFEVPFGYEAAVMVNPDPRIREELERQICEQKPRTPADQLNRYPRDKNGKPWEGLFSFEASSFASVIAKVREDIGRLKQLIFNS